MVFVVYQRTLYILFTSLILSSIGSLLYFSQNPLLFIKLVTVKPTDLAHSIERLNNQHLDIEPLIRNIPYQGGYSSAVLPRERYQQTIVEGYGECSNLSYGLAYHLGQNDIDYLILHFLDIQQFPVNGHVAVATHFQIDGEKHTGIVDLQEGGLPFDKDGYIDVPDLTNANIGKVAMRTLNERKQSIAFFYQKNYLDKTVIGVMRRAEVEHYFDFISRYHLNFGGGELEKYFYLGLSLLTGKYPTIYLQTQDFENLMAIREADRIIAVTTLLVIRVIIVLLPAVSLLVFFKMSTSSRYRKK